MGWNPFKRDAPTEKRSLDVNSLSWPSALAASQGVETMEGAVRLAPVFAAGRLLSSSIASMPLKFYNKQGDSRVETPTPPLFESPSVVGYTHDWLQRLIVSLVYRGNAVGIITEVDAMERPLKLEWLNPADCYVEDCNPSGPGSFWEPIWYFRGNRLPSEYVVHIPWIPTPGRVWGLSPLAAYAMSVSTGLAAQKFADDWYKAGGHPPGVFRNAQQTVDQEAAQVIKTRLVQGLRSHEPLVFGNDWEYTPISVNPVEGQFVEAMQLTANQIAAVYGIPPHMIGGTTGDSMTYANVESQSIAFVQFCLLPWLTKLEEVFSKLTPRNQYVKFNVDSLIRTDASTRYENYYRARTAGLMSVDEIRALEDMPPLPNGDGEDYRPLPLIIGEFSASLKGTGDPANDQSTEEAPSGGLPRTPLPSAK